MWDVLQLLAEALHEEFLSKVPRGGRYAWWSKALMSSLMRDLHCSPGAATTALLLCAAFVVVFLSTCVAVSSVPRGSFALRFDVLFSSNFL